MVNVKTFGDRLKELREEKGLTQGALGEMLNVKDTSISNWENGRRFPDKETLVKMANIFNVTTDYLLNNSENKNLRYITTTELKTFLPDKLVDSIEIKALVDILDDQTKQEIIEHLKKKGYLS
jgi:transcriptional regulator with XRE-family HTH domain